MFISGIARSALTRANPMMWVKLTLPPRERARWLLTTTRLSMSSLAGTARTLVAVGTASEDSMLVTTRAAGPRSGATFSVISASPSLGATATSRGFFWAAGGWSTLGAGACWGALAAGAWSLGTRRRRLRRRRLRLGLSGASRALVCALAAGSAGFAAGAAFASSAGFGGLAAGLAGAGAGAAPLLPFALVPPGTPSGV